jgi:ribose 5-phosphate isomerase A
VTPERLDAEKRIAAARAVALVEDGMRVGLGTGSTAAHAVRLLGLKVHEGLRVVGVPTSEATAELARACGVPLASLDDMPELDLCIDGVDEADGNLDAIKGGGGALLREKIVASASRRVVYICDSSKRVERLGAFPLPVEVVPFAVPVVGPRLRALGPEPVLRRDPDGRPFVTDEGNRILDCPFGRIDDPARLAAALDAVPGVVEHGLFLGMIDRLIVGTGERAEILSRP